MLNMHALLFSIFHFNWYDRFRIISFEIRISINTRTHPTLGLTTSSTEALKLRVKMMSRWIRQKGLQKEPPPVFFKANET